MTKENNKMQVDIDTLKKQNVNDLLSIKEIYSKLEELGEKITQVKYIDNTLVKKIKKEYGNLKKIILDENVQLQLDNKIDEFNLNLTHDIETINSQLDNITKIIPPSNGVDDTNTIQQFFNSLNSGDIVKPMSDLYIITSIILENVSNVKFIGNLKFKIKNGANARNSNFRIDRTCNNISFDNLEIEGNREKQDVLPTDIGQFTVLMIDGNNIHLDNLKINNSTFSAISQNGNSKNIYIKHLMLSNIGEHGIYRSGGGNSRLVIDNLIVNNIGMNTIQPKTHECYVIKERGDVLNLVNEELIINNANVCVENTTHSNNLFYATNGSKNVKLNNIKLTGKMSMFMLAGSLDFVDGCWENIELNGFEINNGTLALNSTNFEGKAKGIKIKNGYIKGTEYLSNLTNFDFIENVVIDNVQIQKHQTGETINNNSVTFKNCEFINYDKEYCRIGDYDSDISFINCNFKDKLTSSKTYAFYGLNANRKFNFENCKGDFSNFTYFIYTVTNSNVKLKDCNFHNADIGANTIGGLLEIYNTIISSTRAVLCELWTTKFTKAIIKDLYDGNMKSRTKVVGQLSFSPSESSKSITINGNDITLAPSLNYEHIKIYPNKPINYALTVDTSKRTFTITLTDAPSITTVFNYVVDITTKGV